MRTLLAVMLASLSLLPSAQPQNPNTQTIFEQTKAATVLILSGQGAGRLTSIATGVIVSKNGDILTALHAIKGAAEVQVRTSAGDTYDQVVLTGTDERRDIASLRITAGRLPALTVGSSTNLTQGEPVYAVTNAGGLTWSATEGILSAIRPADEVPGAGSGFRLLQFTAPVTPGASGGALVDRTGSLIGIITSKEGSAAFAVPIENVIGLPESGRQTFLGSGSSLQMPKEAAAASPQSSAAIANAKPQDIVRNAKTIYIHSKTSFLTVDTVDRALEREKQWPELGLTIVQDPRVADLFVEIDRPLFTYVHTFVVIDKRTSIVLDSGKVTAFDGTIASGGIAKDLVKFFAAAKIPGGKH